MSSDHTPPSEQPSAANPAEPLELTKDTLADLGAPDASGDPQGGLLHMTEDIETLFCAPKYNVTNLSCQACMAKRVL